jgi:dipeptidyl-peptidase III
MPTQITFGKGWIIAPVAYNWQSCNDFLKKSLQQCFIDLTRKEIMKKVFYLLIFILLIFKGCQTLSDQTNSVSEPFQFITDQFADLQILRYQVPGFDDLTLKEKQLVYYLYEAGLSGRDIIYDQNFKHNLKIRRTIEAIVKGYSGSRDTKEFNNFMTWAKRFWFSNGIHHHYSTRKLIPEIPESYFAELIQKSSADFPLRENETKETLIEFLTPIIFDPEIYARRVNQDPNVDNVVASANNFYEGVTHDEVIAFYEAMRDPDTDRPVLYGLNSKLVKENGQIKEKIYRHGGMYTEAIERIIYWLQRAVGVAENNAQQAALNKLIEYYQTGDLKIFDDYNVLWVADTASTVDVINGFIEVYGDAIGLRGAYESVVSIKDKDQTELMKSLEQNAQWFEDNAPFMDQHKKENVTGISYKVITVIAAIGDASPSTPIGINLPNSDWIRKDHGSKSVSLGNIKDAFTEAFANSGAVEEFVHGEEQRHRAREYGTLSSNIHTALHEVIGHGSGQLEPGVPNLAETLKNYSSALEEARADLVSLYFMIDPKLVEMGLIPSIEVGKAQYDGYIRNGLMLQLRRIEPGDNIEQAHMRNRQTVAAWAYERGKPDNVIEKIRENGKTYFVINDYEKLRELFGELLREVQRIKSQGDFEAGKNLIENYGVKVDQELLKEVRARYEILGSAPYSGFIQPRLVPVMRNKNIVDVKVEYPNDFVKQMMEYGEKYSFLPDYN